MEVGRVQSAAGERQPAEDGARQPRIDRDLRRRRPAAWNGRRPGSDRPVLAGVEEARRCSFAAAADDEAAAAVEDDAGRSAAYGDRHRLLVAVAGVERARPARFVRNPPGPAGPRRKSPGVHELRVGPVRDERAEDEPVATGAARRGGGRKRRDNDGGCDRAHDQPATIGEGRGAIRRLAIWSRYQ